MVRDVTKQEGYQYPELATKEGIRSLLSVPMILKDHAIGVLNVYSADERSFSNEDLRLLFGPGSSLGGARPKASVREKDGHLAIAKFPRKDDEINTVVWEAVALTLAQKAGIVVPEGRIETISRKPVLLLRRFDRDGKRRIPFLSAMRGN